MSIVYSTVQYRHFQVYVRVLHEKKTVDVLLDDVMLSISCLDL